MTLPRDAFVLTTPASFWSFEPVGLRYVHRGWFLIKKPCFLLYCHGFQAQYIAVTEDGEVHVQLRGDAQWKFDDPPPEDEVKFLGQFLAPSRKRKRAPGIAGKPEA